MKRTKKLIIANLLVILIGLIIVTGGALFFDNEGELSTGQKNILVCAVDEGEPRPGMGGCDMAFIIELNNGTLTGYTPIYPSGLTHPNATEPQEAQEQGAGEKLLLHDAFWYEDNEQSMKYAKEIVEYQKNVSIDAVVAVNSEALDSILAAASPLKVNGQEINSTGIDFIRDEQDSDGLSRGDAVMEVAKAVAESANDPTKRATMIETAFDQYSKGNIVMTPQGAFAELIASKGLNSFFS
ncbi:DUF4012 domain-containing protein [Methanobrevibacter sp. DSM 116169]|uniref:DUF4012 domain-containing protein n=1 Tax=Methanobrevibacter sp. DSM 116169 TaxID=3242727 RepID=UPI0038FC04F7